MKVAVIKYNAGNIQSVKFALQRLGIEAHVSDEPKILKSADRIIFPGVGEASSAMQYLQARGLDKIIVNLKQPVLGICLGLQLMCRHSAENDVDGLNIFDVNVRRFPPQDKVPHMGWNTIRDLSGPLFEGINPETYVYFVHSYFAELSAETSARSDYILPFSSALYRDNFYAVQFHPEKSGKIGEHILRNFLEL